VGGPGIHGFTFVLLIGILVGTYSSIAIAAPILLIGEDQGRDGPQGSGRAITKSATTQNREALAVTRQARSTGPGQAPSAGSGQAKPGLT